MAAEEKEEGEKRVAAASVVAPAVKFAAASARVFAPLRDCGGL